MRCGFRTYKRILIMEIRERGASRVRASYARCTDWHSAIGAAITFHLPVVVCVVLLAVLSGEIDHPVPTGVILLLLLFLLVDMVLGALRTRLGGCIAAAAVPEGRLRSLWISAGDREELWFRASCGSPYPLDLHVYCDESGAVFCDCFDPNREDHPAYRPWTRI